jgi:hypothetical protein
METLHYCHMEMSEPIFGKLSVRPMKVDDMVLVAAHM